MDLEDFSIYRPFEVSLGGKHSSEKKTFSGELASLHKTNRRFKWHFNGFISYGDKKAYVENVPFTTVSIGGYEDNELDTVSSNIFIQSVLGRKLKIQYNLKLPASEYKRYHHAFLWIANLSKHVNDYLRCHKKVSLLDFRSSFSSWLQKKHGASTKFKSWQSKYGDTDYRRAVAAHVTFLSRQALLVDKRYGSHPFWGEMDWEHLNAVPKQTSSQSGKTLVTPFVYDEFSRFPFAEMLEPVEIAQDVLHRREGKAESKPSQPHGVVKKPEIHSGGSRRISVGDVVEVKPDKRIKWYGNGDSWYGFVQGITKFKNKQALDIIWLCRPSDTAIQRMKYRFDNELFLSHDCNCEDPHIYADEVVRKLQVDFSADPRDVDYKADFFVRQTYGVKQGWVTLRESDLRCTHRCSEPSGNCRYEAGDTLLVNALSPTGQAILEPVELDEEVSDRTGLIRVRRFPRRNRDYQHEDAEANELVYTSQLDNINVKDIVRRCHIRFFTEEDKQQKRIPDQYHRKVTGDFYYILCHDRSYNSNHPDDSHLTALSRP